MEERRYRVGELAALTGVSIRTLHHYDEIGLLRPSARTAAGYRLYSERDLLALQQILTLRYLGFALRQIGEILGRPDFDVAASLRIQRAALRDRADQLARVGDALDALLAHHVATGRWDWHEVARASAAVQREMERQEEDAAEYYTAEQMRRRLAEIGRGIAPEEMAETQRRWGELVREVRANRDLDPASPAAQTLAARWSALLAEMAPHYGDDPKLAATIQRNYERGAYAHIPDAPTMDDFAFIQRAMAARDRDEP